MISQDYIPLVANNVPLADTAKATWDGGRGTFAVEAGAWGGGNVKLQWRAPSGTWLDIDATLGILSANGMVNLELPPGELRAVVTTATGVNAWVIGTRIR